MPFDPMLFEKRIRAGSSLNEALRKGESAMGTRAGLKRYCDANPEWWTQLQPIAEANTEAAKKRAFAHTFEGKTHCRNGHLLTESMGIKKSNGTRYCRFCNSKTVARGGRVSEEKIEEIARAMITGMSAKQITNRVDGRKAIVNHRTWRRLKIERPELAKLQFLHGGAQARFNLSRLQAVVRVNPAEFEELERRSTAPSAAIEVYVPLEGDVQWLYSLTPRHLPRHARDEIVGNIFLELSERRIGRAGVPACAKAMVRTYNRENPTKAYGNIKSPFSLDAPAGHDTDLRLIDRISNDRVVWDEVA